MAIRVFDTSTGATFTYPITPPQVGLSFSGKFIEYNLIGSGGAKIPNGAEVTEVSFSGMLPGLKRGKQPYIIATVNPLVAVELFKKWLAQGIKLQLTIDGAGFNDPVYLQNYKLDESGGYGDISYDISFVAALEVVVRTTAYNGSGRPGSATPTKITYTTLTGETLYTISKKVYGNGKYWSKIYTANTTLIKSKSQKLPGGLVLVIP